MVAVPRFFFCALGPPRPLDRVVVRALAHAERKLAAHVGGPVLQGRLHAHALLVGIHFLVGFLLLLGSRRCRWTWPSPRWTTRSGRCASIRLPEEPRALIEPPFFSLRLRLGLGGGLTFGLAWFLVGSGSLVPGSDFAPAPLAALLLFDADWLVRDLPLACCPASPSERDSLLGSACLSGRAFGGVIAADWRRAGRRALAAVGELLLGLVLGIGREGRGNGVRRRSDFR